jgi:hypothetical protein
VQSQFDFGNTILILSAKLINFLGVFMNSENLDIVNIFIVLIFTSLRFNDKSGGKMNDCEGVLTKILTLLSLHISSFSVRSKVA